MSLLGKRALEEVIQEELISRYPPSLFPFDIEVVGDTVYIAGAAALLECSRGQVKKASLLAAVAELVSQLQPSEASVSTSELTFGPGP